MKRIISLLTCAAVLLGFAACGVLGGDNPPAETTTEPITTTKPTTTAEPTTTAPVTQPVKVPDSYKDAPAAYKPILDDLYRFVTIISGNEMVDILPSGKAEIMEMPYGILENDVYQKGFMGYAVKDINQDGVPELIILSKAYDGKNVPFIYSIFTLKNNKPVNIGIYWSRNKGKLAADGTIYNLSSGGAAYTHFYSYRLKSGASKLTLLTEYQSDTNDDRYPDKSIDIYYQVVDGEKIFITRDEFFNDLWDKYDNPPNPMPLDFIPID